MPQAVKTKIYRIIDGIEDETVLNQIMEDVSFYASETDIVDELNNEQVKELDEAIKQADNGESISLDQFKKEIDEWRKK